MSAARRPYRALGLALATLGLDPARCARPAPELCWAFVAVASVARASTSARPAHSACSRAALRSRSDVWAGQGAVRAWSRWTASRAAAAVGAPERRRGLVSSSSVPGPGPRCHRSPSPPTSRSRAGPRPYADPHLCAAIVDRLIFGSSIKPGTTPTDHHPRTRRAAGSCRSRSPCRTAPLAAAARP